MNVRLLLFATAREAAGRSRDDFEVAAGTPLDGVLTAAVDRYGAQFSAVLAGGTRVWVNGDEPAAGDPGVVELHDGDEVAVLPPVSGGAIG